MAKIVVLEMTPETMMDACLTLANMVVRCKQNPKFLEIIPNECAEEMVLSIFRVLVERSKKGVDPAQEEVDEEKLEQSVNAAMEALLKASGK